MKKSQQKINEVYDFIKEFTEENNYPPTVREIGQHIGIKSTATVYYYLEKLREEGLITQGSNKNRAIGITQTSRSAQSNVLPLVGRISAGTGNLALENIEDFYPLPKDLYSGKDLFLLRVQGDSMTNAGIDDGDLVVVNRQQNADIGEIVVALWQDQATVKRLRCLDPFVLHPENDAMDDIVIDEEDAPAIVGKVVGCLKKF